LNAGKWLSTSISVLHPGPGIEGYKPFIVY